MGDVTTNRSYRKPVSTDSAIALTSYWRNLADDIDVDVQTLVASLNWVVYAPTLYTNSSGSRSAMASTTVNHAWCRIFGNVCEFNADVTAGAASTGGVSLSLPFVAAERWQNCGTAIITGASVPGDTGSASTSEDAIAFMSASQDSIVITSYSNAFLNIASGQRFLIAGSYKV